MDLNKYIEKEFLSEDQLIDSTIKIKTLNLMSSEVNILYDQTGNKNTKAMLKAIKLIIDDAMQIAMYKFQFKLLTLTIEKEIESLKHLVSNE